MVERYTHSHPIPIRWLALVTALNVLVREASCTADHEADASNPPLSSFPSVSSSPRWLRRFRQDSETSLSPQTIGRSEDRRIEAAWDSGDLLILNMQAHVQACSCPALRVTRKVRSLTCPELCCETERRFLLGAPNA